MLEITIPQNEFFMQDTSEFITTKEKTLKLEHSLVSISKWESTWKKAFLGDTAKTPDEYVDYVKCMTITQNVDPMVYNALTAENSKAINAYMLEARTATTVKDQTGGNSREIITSELIYFWMVSLSIPFECQKWHISRLLTLIKVTNAKQNPKKMNKREQLSKQRQLNAERRKKLNSTG